MFTPECRKCGYDLTGMPNEGKCPECGLAYNIKFRDGIRLPESPVEKSQRIYARTRTIIFIVLGVVSMAVAVYAQLFLKLEAAIYTLGFFGVVMMITAGISYLSEKED